jgi:membrane fusion protein (multidrug efflux system)
MALTFSRSLRSLEADSFRRSLLAIGVAIALLAAWAGWFTFARVPVYEISTEARVEAASAAHAIDAPVAGRVVTVNMTVGLEVEAGQPLVELDTERVSSRVAEEDARLQGLVARLDALREARAAEVATGASQRRADATAIDGAEARQQQAVSAQRLAEAEARRTAELSEQGLASAADLEQAREAAEQQRAAVAAAESDLARLRAQRDQNDSAHRGRLADSDRQIATLEAEVEQIRAAAGRLDREVADRVIRAPVAGRLGEVAELRPGAVVIGGERIAVVIPEGELVLVSRFPVASALGRVRAGQEAKMRLDAFPWIHYGQVRARVIRVGSEPADGAIRVELQVDETPAGVALEHGLSGTVAVTVERVSPALLVLRAVGKRAADIR